MERELLLSFLRWVWEMHSSKLETIWSLTSTNPDEALVDEFLSRE